MTPGSKDSGKHVKERDLNAQEHTEYRGGVGVAQYMAEHRIDAAFATKELMREASKPKDASWARLKRLGRYYKGRPRCVIDFPWIETVTNTVTIYVDSDWGGDSKERRSTSAGVILMNGHILRQWSSTQATPSLSSGDAETKAITKGAVEGLHLKHILSQQGREIEIEILSDSSAALGAVRRLGVGKRMKHLEIQHLWIQQLIRNGLVRVGKVSTRVNVADILTKHVSREWLDEVCRRCHIRFPGEEAVNGAWAAPPFADEEDEMDTEGSDVWSETFTKEVSKLSGWRWSSAGS